MTSNLRSDLHENDHRFNKNLNWVIAIDAFDYDARDLLADLITTKDIPKELRPVIAKIISGERKPNLKAAAKLKISANVRLEYAAAISQLLGIIYSLKVGDNFYLGQSEDGHPIMGRILQKVADDQMKEPIEVKRLLEQKAREIISKSALSLKVSEETIENILRTLRKKIENYPNV